ncbi:hypothetical protein FOI68_17810 [Brevibacillus sp. LEMMJ03]|uniref:hypothetical protein n=1 Tax=Brevibacillus sp. LEMMJ03 TaxID=2595056 RepID=UPI0011815B19|nr:hypothetical protein [Brevibacillus sp. LEMMJ03]TRY24268.1 hypothetical protein FOI68_17810 [Brevibacillus sp. LEMMJ03]
MKRPTYTLSSIIKKVFRSGERSLPREEICSRLEASGLITGFGMDGSALLAKVLRMDQSPVRVGRSEAIIELTYQPHQLFDLAYRFVRDTHTPKTLEQIAAELRRQTQFGWNQIMRMLQLERDPRFVQYQGDARWFLAEWTLANDQVYAFCRANGITQVAARSVHHFLEQEAGVAVDAMFLPALDDRFRLDGETLYIIARDGDEEEKHAGLEAAAAVETAEEAEPEADPAEAGQTAAGTIDAGLSGASRPQSTDVQQGREEQRERSETHHHHEVHEQLHFEEELSMNTVQNQSVLEEVQQLLRQALGRLEARSAEMAQEVVAHFQQSNMQAIEVLMKEKHKNEQIALGIQQVLAATEQQ